MHGAYARLARAASRSSAMSAGSGLMIGFELVHDQQTKERAPELRDRLVTDGV